jgi:hypothetical protein
MCNATTTELILTERIDGAFKASLAQTEAENPRLLADQLERAAQRRQHRLRGLLRRRHLVTDAVQAAHFQGLVTFAIAAVVLSPEADRDQAHHSEGDGKLKRTNVTPNI